MSLFNQIYLLTEKEKNKVNKHNSPNLKIELFCKLKQITENCMARYDGPKH